MKNNHKQTQDAASAIPPAPVHPPFSRLPENTVHLGVFPRLSDPASRRDRLGAKMQSPRQFELLCDWSANQTVWFCHGNGICKYAVAVLQSAAVDAKIPATKQDKQSFLG